MATPIRRIHVHHLARHEWGSELMRHRAEQILAARPELDAVEVREHAGWFLTYANGSLDIIGTANDRATVTQAMLDFWREKHVTLYTHDRAREN